MFTTSKATRDQEFTEFVADAQASLSGTAWLLTGNRDRAADLVQSALVKTYANWSKVRRADALAYARRILINENVDRWRSAHGEVLADGFSERPDPHDATDGIDQHDEVVRLLADLPPAQRKVIVLRYFNDMSEREIAETLGISTGAVKSAASRGLDRLRTLHAEGALR